MPSFDHDIPAALLPTLPTTPLAHFPPALTPQEDAQVQRYRTWLAGQARQKLKNYADAEQYQREATAAHLVKGKPVATFAPFHQEFSALQTFTPYQIGGLCVLPMLWIAALAVFRLGALAVAVSLLTTLYTVCLCVNVVLALRSARASSGEQIDDAIVHALHDAEWPRYTVLCPLYKEARIVPQFVQAMLALDYPLDRLQILFLTEENDRETRAAIRALSLPPSFQIVVVPDGQPRTKPRACNYGLLQATGSYVVIYDAEDIPDPLQLKKAVLTFANNDLQTVCVQAKLNFYNSTQNLLTRWFTAEYSTWFSFILPGLQRANFVIPLGGTSNHFRAGALRALGGWDAYNVTEDCDLGLRLKRFKMKTVILDSTTLEEANPNLKNWIRQRSRWIKGYMQTYLVYMRNPLKTVKEGRIGDFLSFQIVVGSGVGLLFFNPLMWILMGSYIVLGNQVIDLYHELFPGPMLYAGAFCLIFGNFFYVYLYLLASARRKDYHLVFWSLFIPIYWLLMSVAGMYAFIELLVRPHYWQKTNHGLHLGAGGNIPLQAAPLESATQSVPAIRAHVNVEGAAPRTITTRLKGLATLPVPVLSWSQKRAQERAKKTRVKDLWFLLTVTIAGIASMSACLYYFEHHEILLYDDAYSHLRLARMVFDSATPGLAQLGGVWLPLPHILMWPFIWNDVLLRTGLAGSFVSMICYMITSAYLFLTIRRFTRNSAVSFLGTLIFISNPNVLYLQCTPLSELTCFCTLAMTCYYFLAWLQESTTRYLVLAAISEFLASLARYDGWSLFAILLCLIVCTGVVRRNPWKKIQGNALLFLLLGGLGIFLWLAWNKLIFGDPLFFQHGQFSSQASQLPFIQNGTIYTFHNLPMAIKTYSFNVLYSLGNIVSVLAIVAAFCFCIRRHFKVDVLIALALVAPFLLYVSSLYSGQSVIWVPGIVPAKAPIQYFNVRYGAEMVGPAAFFIAVLLHRICQHIRKRVAMLIRFGFVAMLLLQVCLLSCTGIISLQDGLYGLSCDETHPINAYLIAHYDGGRILDDVTTGDFSFMETGIDFQNIVYDGSNKLWIQALADPQSVVHWVITTPKDLIEKHIDVNSPSFLRYFTLVVQESAGTKLYQSTALGPLPNRSVPNAILHDHNACPTGH